MIKPAETITLNLLGGTSIDTAAEKAVSLVKQTGRVVEFKFNGIDMRVLPGTNAKVVKHLYNLKIAEASEAYRKSPEGKEQARKSAEQLENCQLQVTVLSRILIKGARQWSSFEEGHPWFVKWVKDFAAVNDLNGLEYDKAAIAKALEQAGYKEHDCTGDEFVKDSRPHMARYIVGQAIACLKSGMPIHGIAIKFCDEYLGMTT